MEQVASAQTLQEILGTEPEKRYTELFKSYYDILCHFALKHVHEPTLAEQCVMDVFTKMWDKRAELVIKTDLKYYLFASVRNRTMDMHRRNSRKAALDHHAERTLCDGQSSADDRYHWKQALIMVETAIEALPTECRRIFRMSREDGLKYQEIADELQLSVKTVETQMTRALKSIRPLRPVIGL